MTIKSFLQQVELQPDSIEFADTMAVIDAAYNFKSTQFHNGDLLNKAGSNEGSCKIFAFAQLHSLTPQQTLACFGHYYRQDVLLHPEADDHGNIRNFMQTGWAGIRFEQSPLVAK